MKRFYSLLMIFCLFFVSGCADSGGFPFFKKPESPVPAISDTSSDGSEVSSSAGSVVSVSPANSDPSASSETGSKNNTSSSSHSEPPAGGTDLTDKAVLSGKNVDPSKPMVAITFDDGPSKRGTGSILDVLEKYDAVATFFDVGSNVERLPDIVRREAELGCEIASHTYSHSNLNKMTDEERKADIAKADKAFINAVGRAPIMIRPPYGSCSKDVAASLGRAVILWSVDTLDWKTRDSKKIIESVKSAGNLDRKCILMHGIYEETAKALDVIIPYLLDKGYQLVTVSEMITVGKGDRIISGNRYGYSYFR